MRPDDAPTIEPGRILPRGDGDGCNGRSVLPFHPGSTVGDGDDPFIRVDDNSSIYRGTRNYESTTGNLLQLCLRSGNGDLVRHGNPILRGK